MRKRTRLQSTPTLWSPERQRRSRVDWIAWLGPERGRRQIFYERHLTALAMSEAGMTYQEIGECFGCSRCRIGQIIGRIKRQRLRVAPAQYGVSPEILTAMRNYVCPQ